MAILYFLVVWLAACAAGGIAFWLLFDACRRFKQRRRDEFSFRRDRSKFVNEVPAIDPARLAWRRQAAMPESAPGTSRAD